MIKRCKDCGVEKDIQEFNITDKERGYRKSYCKECSYNRAVEWIEENTEQRKQYMNRYYAENPDKFVGNHVSKSVPAVCGIYKITCDITQDFYIGTSKNIRDRIYKHKRNVGRSKNKKLSKLIKQWGWENFSVAVLEECSEEVRFEKETAWIEYMNPQLNDKKVKR